MYRFHEALSKENADDETKGSFTLRDETMWYQTNDNLIAFNNGLGPLKTKSGGRGKEGDVLGGDMSWGVLTHF